MWQQRRLRARTSKSSAGSKKRKDIFASALSWIAVSLGVFYLTWLILFPNPRFSGNGGHQISEHLISALGTTRYLLPIFLINGVLLRLRRGKSGWIMTIIASTAGLFFATTVLALLGRWLNAEAAGGFLGTVFSNLLSDKIGIGDFGAFMISLAGFLFCAQLTFGINWPKVASSLIKILADDYRQWQKARAQFKQQVSQAAPQVLPATHGSASNSAITSDDTDMPTKERPTIKPVEIKSTAKSAAPRATPGARPSVAPAQDSPYRNYQLPPITLLNPPPPAQDRGKPLESESQSAIIDLERTLKSFDIDAKVAGYAPGPVITRYELSPAPGVKVSSIVALENDIALAMKAKGIRIIAPIPGKAAVGIEIPNHRPALVVLREILESPALPPEASLLAFALGLSAGGDPVAADLTKMPHVLIAGATNSGKSVAIHSLILSMLFRARPDEVKFLMIDPKRLELTLYDGIPHLFDPITSADKVGVVTNPKDAAKSLTALLKLMDKRYETFQLFGVRNIESYNKEADKRGKPREYYVVVVIDELADLMLVAGDQVEDSIQRLTQMARAVGIHVVLATQRPSVDVITGVIKANLPSRIALQVISKVDSKVILDCSGAETLQGKGDLLYLAAGAQKPERCQGAYVTEDEIGRLVSYLREQGKPSYPQLETMIKAAEADLSSFGVEPLEFSQALKLVLERRRVSQDLLKSQFGSSARATNILSLLEVKEFIHKPEGSNRWEIHFDLIEDYMRQHFPQVPIGGK